MLPDRVTLSELLSRLEAADAGLLDVNLEELDEISGGISEKCDSYKIILDRLASREQSIAKEIEELHEHCKAYARKQQILKDHLLFQMRKYGWDSLQGKKHKITIGRAESFVPSFLSSPTSDLAKELPQFVRTKHEWDATAIKHHIKAGNVFTHGSIIEKSFIKFSLRKDV